MVSTSGMSTPSLKMSTVKMARNVAGPESLHRLSVASRRPSSHRARPRAGPRALNFSAMNRAWCDPTQNPSARICVGSSTHSMDRIDDPLDADVVTGQNVLEVAGT